MIVTTKTQKQVPQKAPTASKADSEAQIPEVIHNSKSTLRVTKTLGGKKTSSALMLHGQRAMSPAFMAPDLVPLCRVKVSSTLAIFNGFGVLNQGTNTYVADPTGNATNALGVFQWGTRFSGFQQYRLRSTEWVITPLNATSAPQAAIMPGYAIAFVEDDPQAGAASQAVALASYPRARVPFGNHPCAHITYDSNEPGDLDLSDINTPPNKIVNGSVKQGGHCLNIYTDNGFFGFNPDFNTNTFQLLGIQAVYDIEFFGIGGV
jgi:hypothetical protein